MSTLDGWSDVMYVNAFGCDKWQTYSFGRYFSSLALKSRNNCNHPKAWGWISVAYFLSFVVMSAQVLMTLFIGIISTAMEEATSQNTKDQLLERRVDERSKVLNISPSELTCYRRIYQLLLRASEGPIGREELKPLIPCVNDIWKACLLFLFILSDFSLYSTT